MFERHKAGSAARVRQTFSRSHKCPLVEFCICLARRVKGWYSFDTSGTAPVERHAQYGLKEPNLPFGSFLFSRGVHSHTLICGSGSNSVNQPHKNTVKFSKPTGRCWPYGDSELDGEVVLICPVSL